MFPDMRSSQLTLVSVLLCLFWWLKHTPKPSRCFNNVKVSFRRPFSPRHHGRVWKWNGKKLTINNRMGPHSWLYFKGDYTSTYNWGAPSRIKFQRFLGPIFEQNSPGYGCRFARLGGMHEHLCHHCQASGYALTIFFLRGKFAGNPWALSVQHPHQKSIVNLGWNHPNSVFFFVGGAGLWSIAICPRLDVGR